MPWWGWVIGAVCLVGAIWMQNKLDKQQQAGYDKVRDERRQKVRAMFSEIRDETVQEYGAVGEGRADDAARSRKRQTDLEDEILKRVR